MATMFIGRLLNNLCTTQRHGIGFNNQIFIQSREYAARKGTRARREAKKIKRKIEKVEKIGYVERMFKLKQAKTDAVSIKIESPHSGKPVAVDDVWSSFYHRPKIYTFEEALQCHRETHHPTILNCPNSFINAKIALNLQTEKKTKVIGGISRIIQLPHFFNHGESRNIVAFGSNLQMLNEAREAGANLVGGKELIKAIKAGEVSLHEYEFCLAHPDMLADLVLIRGLLKNKFPTTKQGTLGPILKDLVSKFVLGVKYNIVPHKLQKTYGTVECSFGTLNMDTKHLEENLSALLNDLNSIKTKKMSSFILRTQLSSPPSKEVVEIEFKPFIESEEKRKATVKEEEEEEEDEELDDGDVSRVVIPSQ